MRPLSLIAAMLLAGPLAHANPSSLRQAHVATLANRLQLDAPLAERVQSVVDKYNARQAPLQRADVDLLGQLRTQLALTVADAGRMKSLSGELVKNRQKLQALRDDRLHELQKTLTPEQFSRLLVRWSSLTRELRRQARRARKS
jgi:Spy/CpxP family protein refolding chaperone